MIVGIYFANWSIYARNFEPARLPLESVSHVFYAFFKPNRSTGEIELSDKWADAQKTMRLGGKGCLGELKILKAQFPHLRVLLSIGGYSFSGDMTDAIRDSQKRDRFVKSASLLCSKFGMDGVDIDWEYPSVSADGSAFVDLVAKLAKSLGPEKEISIASPAGMHNLKFFPLKELDRFVSFWNVMAYDFCGPWSSTAEHHANLHRSVSSQISGDEVLQYYLQYIDASKLILGIPLYGRSFCAKTIGSRSEGNLPGKYERGIHDYKELPPEEYRVVVDSKSVAAIATNGSVLISFDNIETVSMKALYVKQHSLGGAMFWEASADHEGGKSLVKAFVNASR